MDFSTTLRLAIGALAASFVILRIVRITNGQNFAAAVKVTEPERTLTSCVTAVLCVLFVIDEPNPIMRVFTAILALWLTWDVLKLLRHRLIKPAAPNQESPDGR